MNEKKLQNRYTVLILVTMLAVILACGKSESAAIEYDTKTPASEAAFEIIPVNNPVPANERIFGINISEGQEGFGAAFAVAQEAGIQAVELILPWDMVEPKPGEYQDPNDWLSLIGYYGENNIDVLLNLAIINTSQRTTPDYLSDLPYDDPQVIDAFNKMADWVLANVAPGVTIPAVSIGNEIDLFLAADEWEAYTTFYDATATYMQTNHPELNVGVKVTMMESILGPHLAQAQRINRSSTVVMVNYYPQNENFEVLSPEVVHEHFQNIVDAFPDQEIWITEVGYQSGSEHCRSSEAMQAQFYHEMFDAWDEHPQITFVMVNWLHDQSKEALKEFEKYYGYSAPAFIEYLGTLGLRNYDHTDKAAWLQVLEETNARGWTE